jgi:hypothetical protein
VPIDKSRILLSENAGTCTSVNSTADREDDMQPGCLGQFETQTLTEQSFGAQY